MQGIHRQTFAYWIGSCEVDGERDRVLRGRRCRGVSICFTGSYRPLCYAAAGRNRGVSCCGIGRLGYLGNHIKVWVGWLPSLLRLHPPIASLSRYGGWSRVYLSDNEVSSGLVQLAFEVLVLHGEHKTNPEWKSALKDVQQEKTIYVMPTEWLSIFRKEIFMKWLFSIALICSTEKPILKYIISWHLFQRKIVVNKLWDVV